MEHEGINSSVIASAAYDDERMMLAIRFRNGRVYAYSKVPRSVYDDLVTCESAGKYFNDVIRTTYDSELIYDPERPRVTTT